MRGAPFGESNFSRGLNVIDAPYELQNGEARDCLNVVSTPRGAIRKRGGSLTFADSEGQTFPAEVVVDTFKRAPENPLNNGGKWELIGTGADIGAQDTGQITSETWQGIEGKKAFALWNVTNQKNPAVTCTLPVVGKSPSMLIGCCFSKTAPATLVKGYALELSNPAAPAKTTWTLILRKYVGSATEIPVLATISGVELVSGDKVGLTVREGKIKVWVRHGGVWKVVAEATDSTYTEGFAVIGGESEHQYAATNFSLTEYPAPTKLPASGAKSIGAALIAGVPFLVIAVTKKLYSVTAAGVITQIQEGMTEGKRWSMVQSEKGTRVNTNGPFYMSNGTDPPQTWSGTGVAKEWTSKPEGAFAAVPKAKFLIYLANRIWAAGITTPAKEEAAVRFSGFATSGTSEGEIADPTNWPTENIVYFESEDGQPITGLGIIGSYVLVFKRHKTWAIYNTDEGENRRISDSIGCVSHRSICETPQGTFFLTPDQGVYSTNGSSVRDISRNIRPILQGIGRADQAAKLSELENAAGVYANGHYYLSYTAQDESLKTLDYDTVLQSWWIHDIGALQWVLWEPAVGEAAVYGASVILRGVIKAFINGLSTDSGSNYTGREGLGAYWFSSWEPYFQYVMRHRINQPNTKKRVRQLFVDGKGELISLSFKNFSTTGTTLKGTVDAGDESAPTSPVKLGPTPEVQAARYYSLGVARVWGFGFGNNSAEPFEVNAYSTNVQFRKS